MGYVVNRALGLGSAKHAEVALAQFNRCLLTLIIYAR